MSDVPGTGLELLTATEMAEADRLAVALGVPSLTLMENAGRAVAEAAMAMVPAGSGIAVLCGPGNNGGDGFVAARLLAERGFAVRVACTVALDQLKGDAVEMARRWAGPLEPPLAFVPPQRANPVELVTAAKSALPKFLLSADLVIDALLGAGLDRPLSGMIRSYVLLLAVLAGSARPTPILAVDVPTGLDGTTGDVPGGLAVDQVIQATRTVTFFLKKPGHLLMPGRLLCGSVTVADIGIPRQALAGLRAQGRLAETFANASSLWRHEFRWPQLSAHKYDRGHALVVSGPAEQTGAARLGARAALRIGAGLVTVASPRAAFPVNAAHLTAIMVMPFEVPGGLATILADKRKNAVLIGPGAGVGATTREMVATALASRAAVVFDADALTSVAEEPQTLFDAVAAHPQRPVVLTPHDGEFKRLFGDICPNGASKLERARAAARRSGAIVVLKGPDTVIAHPDGRAVINENAPPTLATAGSGDVLAGFVTGLLAQRMHAFDAACAAVWLHGACASVFGPGLIAEDLPEVLPRVLAMLAAGSGQTTP